MHMYLLDSLRQKHSLRPLVFVRQHQRTVVNDCHLRGTVSQATMCRMTASTDVPNPLAIVTHGMRKLHCWYSSNKPNSCCNVCTPWNPPQQKDSVNR